jgi:hypothetical protein
METQKFYVLTGLAKCSGSVAKDNADPKEFGLCYVL